MAVVTVSVSFGLHQSNGGLSIYIGSTKKSNSEKPNVKFFTVAPSLEVIFKVALSKGASIETFCTSWPPGGAVWQLHTWNPLVLWVTGIWFEGGRFWAAQSRKINFFRQKLKPFESPDTLTYGVKMRVSEKWDHTGWRPKLDIDQNSCRHDGVVLTSIWGCCCLMLFRAQTTHLQNPKVAYAWVDIPDIG